MTEQSVRQLLSRQREAGVPLTIEWVAENTPTLERVAAGAGLEIDRCPLLVLHGLPRGGPGSARMLGPDDVAELAQVLAAHQSLRSGIGGTAVGSEGLAYWGNAPGAEPVEDSLRTDRSRARYASPPRTPPPPTVRWAVVGTTRWGTPQRSPASACCPPTAVAGLGAALSFVLARDALDWGATTVFCSAENDEVARIYARVGFQRVATACMATG